MSISANVTSSTITASVSGSTVSASVSASTVTASASGGVGPQGPAGTSGAGLSALTDVAISSVTDGDLLRYATGKWRNSPESNLTDGGNY